MPANEKYLMKSSWAKASKIFAAIIGCMIASLSFHFSLALIIGYTYVVPTSVFTIFILWASLMILVYWFDKPWKSWLFLLCIIMPSVAVIYIFKFA